MTEVTTTLKDAVSASFQCVPNEHAPEGADVLGGVIYKGTIESTGKPGFQAVINGHEGQIKPGFGPAINMALVVNNVVPANYDRPEKWSDVYTSNEPPKPKSLDDLDKNDAAEFKRAYAAIDKALSTDDKAIEKRREASFKVAELVREVRTRFATKEQWRMFVEFAPEAHGVKAFLGGKNTVNEYVRAGALLATAGFDAETMVSDRVTGTKGVTTAYQSVINAVAHNAVEAVKSDKARKALGIADGNDALSVRAVLGIMLDDGVWEIGEAANQVELDIRQQALAALVIRVHLSDWPENLGQVFDIEGGSYKVLRLEDGAWVSGSKFGLEGQDELMSALAKAFSRHIAAVDRAVVDRAADDAAGALVSAVRDTKIAFADWPAEMAARHLANILFSRWPEDGSDDDKTAARADIDEIIDKIGGWADAIYAQNASVADILAPDTPESAEAAADDADADMSE